MSYRNRSWNETNARPRSTYDSYRPVRNDVRSDAPPDRIRSIADDVRTKQERQNGGGIGEAVDRHGGKRARVETSATVDLKEREERDSKGEVSPEGDWELLQEEEEIRSLEERRKRRQIILQRHQHEGATSTPSNTVTPTQTSPPSAQEAGEDKSVGASPPSLLRDESIAFELSRQRSEVATLPPGAAEMSAAEYDPTIDRELNREREMNLLGDRKTERSGDTVRDELANGEESEYEEVEVSDDDDDVDDMFAIDEEDTKKKAKKVIRVKKAKYSLPEDRVQNDVGHTETKGSAVLHDNWDDAEGYYRITLGERIGAGGRYQVFANLGMGMFSAVVRARDSQQGDQEVAIKIVRSQESMYKAGVKEIAILQRLTTLDPDDKRHLVRLLGHFEYRGHLCMVFESLSMNLREVIRRFGKDVGLNLRAVRAYAHQMLLALALMRKAEIMHADLKPDNILVNENKTALKICDLGSASDVAEMDITPYLVSRFYRAPEIILGLPYDCALDMWSIGCTLYELFTGRILFPGKSNNHMLLLIQEVKGKFTTKQIRKGRFSGMHFDDQNAFVSRERDRRTGADVLRKVATFSPSMAKTDLRSRILPASASTKGLSQMEVRLTNSFIELISRMLELDPARRITPIQALQHPFFS